MFLIGLATLSGLLFYLTSANSGAMVMANFSASIPDPSEDGPKWLRVFWAVLTAVLTVAMLLAGGVKMGATRQQVIDDVLARYEAHLAFLTFSAETDTASVLTPPTPLGGEQSAVPKDAGDFQDLDEKKA